MGHLNFDKDATKKKGSWKTFYLALAVCLVAVGGVAAATFLSTISNNDPQTSEVPKPAVTTKQQQEVGQQVTNVPDDRTTAKAPQSTAAPTAPATTAPPADLFILPLTNEVMHPYSEGQPVFNKTMGDWRAHNGVDFKGETGQEVKALADGTVKSVEEDILWGKVLVLEHGYGIESKYCGVSTVNLKKGDAVKVGQVIGTLCDIPCEVEDGPHLHLEITVNGEHTDPITAINLEVKYTDQENAE